MNTKHSKSASLQ